jgi:hypothetical protein
MSYSMQDYIHPFLESKLDGLAPVLSTVEVDGEAKRCIEFKGGAPRDWMQRSMLPAKRVISILDVRFIGRPCQPANNHEPDEAIVIPFSEEEERGEEYEPLPEKLQEACRDIALAPKEPLAQLEAVRKAARELALPVQHGFFERPDVMDLLLEQARNVGLIAATSETVVELAITSELDAPPLAIETNGFLQQARGRQEILREPPATDAEPEADLEIRDAGDDPGLIPPRQWLLANQFCLGFISSIVAAGGTGKSALRLLQYICLASGRALTGQHVFRRARVLLINLEDDGNELDRRIMAALAHHHIDRSELKGWLFHTCPKLSKLAELKGKARVVGPLERQIRKAIARYKPDLVALDPFVKTHALEESNSGDMDFVCDLLARLGAEFNLAIDSPHHVHKGLITPGDADAGRGSSGIRDAGRLVYTLTFMSEDEAKLYGIPVEDRSDYIRLDTAKVNLIRRSGKPTWFKLVGVPIGNATPEYPNGDTIQTVEPWSPPDLWADLAPQTLNVILSEIARGMDNGQRYSAAASAGKDRAAWRIVQRHYPAKTDGQCREIIKAWIKTGLLFADDYEDPVYRKIREGLYVDEAKRPS